MAQIIQMGVKRALREVAAPMIVAALGGCVLPGCQLPPDSSVNPVQTGPRTSGQKAGSSEDALRPSCAFAAGARPAETLPISEDERAEIPIKHVVILMKENRSFDHLLGGLHVAGQPDTSGISDSFVNLDKLGTPVAPFELGTTCVKLNPGHQWDDMHNQVDSGAMDGFITTAAKTTNSDGHFVMGHYGAPALPFYYWLADTFAINDRHFASVRSGTWPNRDFLLLGTADGVKCSYCGLPNPATPTIFDALETVGATWGAYTDGAPFDGALGWSTQHVGLHPFRELLTALKEGTLPNVAFVDAVANAEDEHPPADVQRGEAWTRHVYEAAVASPLWSQMALIWTYDEAGGFADDVPPPNSACIARPDNPNDLPFFELGVRVPLAVISPYVRPHFVSHVVQEHTAITRFIELLFDLPALTARDANSDAFLDMFDFEHAPAFLIPPAAPPAGTRGCR